jgi:hypothetical protein
MDTRHPRRLLAPEQVLMRFSIIYDRPSSKYMPSGYGRWNSTRNAKRLEPESSTPMGQVLHEGMPISSGIMFLMYRLGRLVIQCT